MPCHECTNQKYFSGSHHIGCKNPPSITAKFKSGGEEMRKIAQETIEEMMIAEPEVQIVYRCIWKDSGIFPMYYDPSTVLACTNKNVIGDPKEENPLETMLAILMSEGK